MKIFNKFLYLAAALAFVAVSCGQKEEPFEPGPQEVEGCYGVYFPVQDVSGSHILSPSDKTEFDITLKRAVADGDITVPIVAEFSEDGIFTVADATFADGQDETTFKVSFPTIAQGQTYEAHFRIVDNKYASIYSSNAVGLDFSVMQVEMKYFLNPKTGEKAKIHWVQGWWGEEVDGYLQYYEVDGVRTCFTESISDTHYYNGYYDGPGFWGGTGVEWSFIWFVKSGFIRIPPLNTGYHNSSYDADIWALDYFYYTTGSEDNTEFLSYAANNDDVVSFYDGNGGFMLSIRSYYMFGVGGWNPGVYDTYGIAEGFTRVDYTFELETDFSDGGEAPIYITAGPDVTKVKYQVYEGSLNNAQINNKVNEIIDGGDAITLTDELVLDEDDNLKYADLAITTEKSGTYTFVAVAYGIDMDEKSKTAGQEIAQNSAGIVFKCITAADEAEYAVDITVGAEDVPDRYTDYDSISSMAYFIVGSDVTDVHVGVVATATYNKNKDGYNQSVKTNSKLALSAAQLAQVNSAGGYYTLTTGLAPLTSYTVIVWATNGDLETIVTAQHTTQGLPLVPVAVGDYKYTVAFSNWGTDTGVNLCFDPNYNLYVIQNIFYYVDFYFSMDEKGIIHFDPQDTGATYSGIPIYVLEAHDLYTDDVINDPANEIDEEEAADIRANSYYDSENKVYKFNMTFYVPNVGDFGHGWETFTVTSEASAAAPAAAPGFRDYTTPSIRAFNTSFVPAGFNQKFERDAKPAKVEVKVIENAARPEKSIKGNGALTDHR